MFGKPAGGAKRMHGLPSGADLTIYAVFRFWLPLAVTWLMMSGSQPVMGAVVARLPDAVDNLAAFAVGFAIAQFLEFPIIMLLSAATRLVHDRSSYLKLRTFALVLCGSITLINLLIATTPAIDWLASDLIGVPERLHDRVAMCALALVPWPACIGYRRFVQGALIRQGRTELVGYGTAVRVLTVIVVGAFGGLVLQLPGAMAGAIALTASVLAECAVTLTLGRHVIRYIKSRDAAPPPSYGSIFGFYFPLMLTSLLSIATTPLIVFFLGKSRLPTESLAAYPITIGVIQIFRGLAQAYQEIVIALRGDVGEGEAKLRQFAQILGGGLTVILLLIGFTPLGRIVFEDWFALSHELTAIALPAFQISIPYIVGSVLYHWQRAILVHRRKTVPITVATAVEIGFTALTLYVGIHALDMIGIHAAALSLLVGRGMSIVILIPTMRRHERLLPG